MLSALLSTSPTPPMTKRRDNSGSGVNTSDWRAHNVGQLTTDDVFGSNEEDGGVLAPAAVRNCTSSHPGVADGDPIL